MFTHVVMFWLKADDLDAARKQVIADCHRLLGKVPGLLFFDAGVAAMTPREVVDNSYHAALLTVFADKAGHDAYQVHPLHMEFLKRNKPHFERVQIYDFVTGTL